MKRSFYFLIISFALGLSGCKAEEIEYDAMNKSEEAFNKHQQKELVILMPLETMFPDRQVRALAKAAGKGKVKQVDELLAKGVDVNARGKKNTTPLFWALRNSNLNGFIKLLDAGADPNILFAGGSVMHWAAKHENADYLKAALQYGGDPNLVAGQFSETPLFETIGLIGNDRKENRQILLKSGANINARTIDESSYLPIGGQTPVMKAAGLGRFDIVYELLEAGADYKIKNDSGRDLASRVAQNVGAFVSGSSQERDLQKVIAWLSERGVNISQ
ncbi:ankyrin repeat domain-containing protein [Microbulbifer sp. DLAB2-AA]|uniref:ankyrin repeat domain-containing protein n=1 Tax=Microbulbifer sp. DLAB2-AA TaxID=3243394 RepID=UPI004039B06E